MSHTLWKTPALYLALLLGSALGIWTIEGARADVPRVLRERDLAMIAQMEAVRILDQALANPAAAQNDAYDSIRSIRESIFDQFFYMPERGSDDEQQSCFGPSSVDGHFTERSGLVNTGTCSNRLVESGQILKSCRVVLCPAAFTRNYFLVHVILHEMAHTIGILNECRATYTAMMAIGYGGGTLARDGYTTLCGFDSFFR